MKINLNTFRLPLLPLLALATLAGCGGGGMSLVGISPTGTVYMDVGQTLAVKSSIVNDTTNSGVNYSLNGVGSLGPTTSTGSAGSSSFYTATYSTPSSVSGSATAVVTVDSIHTPSATASVTIIINPALVITTAMLPGGTINTVYPTTTLTSTGGYGALKWAVAAGTLPTGLLLSNSGVLSGTPTVFGSFPITISVTDSATNPLTATANYTIVIVPKTPTITTTHLPNGIAGTAYNQTLTFTGGNGSTPNWVITAGSLPLGLTLNAATGAITGTPTNASAGNTYTFTVTVSVGTQTSAPATLTITIYGLPTITTLTLPNGSLGIAYNQQLTYTGGTGGAPTWALASGTLPPGLTFNTTTGTLSGTPTTLGSYNFSITVTVGTQTSAAQAYTVNIYSLYITSAASATGEVNLPFSFHATAVGGTPPYTWSLANGSTALPVGLSINSTTGLISGTPTTAATTTGVVIQAKDSASTPATATQPMTFTINTARTNSNNSELKGQYTFLLSGYDANGYPLASVGTFTADGNGNITAGILDTNGTALTTASTNVALVASTFSVGTDNRGKLNLVTSAGTHTYVLSLDALANGVATGGYLTEFDSTGQGLTGVFSLQTTGAALSGGYAFGASGFAVNSTPTLPTHRAAAGEIQLSAANTYASGEYLSSAGATVTPIVPVAGSVTVSGTGRGTLSVTKPGGAVTVNFVIYVVSSAKFYMLSSDPASGTTGTNDLLFGTAQQQTITNGNFALTSLNGLSVVRSQGLDTSTATGAHYTEARLGLYTFNGAGGVTLSADDNAGGAASILSLSGNYTVASNGRVAATLSTGLGGCVDCLGSGTSYIYLVGANQGYLMDFSGSAFAGTFEPQTATGITNATFSGAYAAGTLLPLSQSVNFVEAVLTSTGSGSANGTADLNVAGTLSPDQAISATYVAATSGRTTFNPTVGDTSVLYIISATKADLLDLATGAPTIEEILHQ
jgi:hypothetical protein